MLIPGLGPNQLRSNDVTHAVGDEDGGSHETLLGVPGDIGHAQRDDETGRATEESCDGVSHNWGRGVVRPLALPDDGAARNDRQAGEDEHDDTYVLVLGAEVPRAKNNKKAQPAQRELEQDRRQRAPAECRHNQGPEAAHCPVHGVRRRHHQRNQPDLDIAHGLLHLRHLELCTPHTSLAMSQPLHSGKPFLLGEKPRRNRRVRNGKAQAAKCKSQRPRQQVDVLPGMQVAAFNLREPIVQRAADDGKRPRAAKPPALAERLLRLGVVACDDAHEAGGDDALHEAEEEALRVQALPRGDGRGEHAYR